MAERLSRLPSSCSPRRMQACVYHLVQAVFKSVLHFMSNFEAGLDGRAEGLEFDSNATLPLVVLLYLLCHFDGHDPSVFNCVRTTSDVEHERCLGSLVLLVVI